METILSIGLGHPSLPEVAAGELVLQRIRLGVLRVLTLRSLKIARRMIFISEWVRSLVLQAEDSDDLRFPVVPFEADHDRPRQYAIVLECYGRGSISFLVIRRKVRTDLRGVGGENLDQGSWTIFVYQG